MKPDKKRVLGILQGVSLGDAMGMPTEVLSQELIREKFPNGIHELLGSVIGGPYKRDLPAGSITDDTVNTLLVCKMLIKNNGKIDSRQFIESLIRWTQDSNMAQYVAGPSTKSAIKAIQNGLPLEKAGITGTTNGAAMKISPVGIVFDYKNASTLLKAVSAICMPTHNTSIAIAGASAIAAIDSYVARGGTKISTIWQIATDFAQKGSLYGFKFPSADLVFRINQAKAIVQTSRTRTVLLSRLYQEVGSGMETIETIPCVLAIVDFAKADAWKAAQLAAEIGWDTDTIGSIATGICGGIRPDSIPTSKIARIEKVNQINLNYISEQLFKVVK